MSKHTPEPWRIEWQPGQTPKHTYTHCVMAGDDSLCDTLTEADAARIVTCVNALAGIEDPAAFVEAVRELLLYAEIDADPRYGAGVIDKGSGLHERIEAIRTHLKESPRE